MFLNIEIKNKYSIVGYSFEQLLVISRPKHGEKKECGDRKLYHVMYKNFKDTFYECEDFIVEKKIKEHRLQYYANKRDKYMLEHSFGLFISEWVAAEKIALAQEINNTEPVLPSWF